MTEKPSTERPVRRSLAAAAGVGLAAAALGLGIAFAASHYIAPKHEQRYVTFDTVRYTNARTAAAAALLGIDKERSEEAVTTLARVDSAVVPAIRKAAAGRLVIVRQALVLDGSVPDITEDVLSSLGLPLDAPTIEPKLSTGPTTRYSQSPLYKFAEDFVREENDRARRELEQERRTGFNELLP